MSKIDITELADLLEDRKNNNSQKIALILGSRAGALFRSQSFIDAMAHYRASPHFFVDMNERERFGACHALLKQAKEREAGNDLEITLKQTIKDVPFSMADDCMAELVKQEIFKMILSFNPDDLLYSAFTALDLKKEDDFVEFDFDHNDDQTVNEIRLHDKIKACKVIKFFNDVEAFIYKLDKLQELESISACVKTLLERMRIKEVLIVGIDLTWDHIILSALPSRLKTVWFVNEDEQVKDLFCSKYAEVGQIRFITGSQGRYDKFIRTLYFQLNPGIPPHRYELTSRLQNQLNVMQQELKSLNDGMKNLQDGNSRVQRQLTKLSMQVEEAHKHDRDKKE